MSQVPADISQLDDSEDTDDEQPTKINSRVIVEDDDEEDSDVDSAKDEPVKKKSRVLIESDDSEDDSDDEEAPVIKESKPQTEDDDDDDDDDSEDDSEEEKISKKKSRVEDDEEEDSDEIDDDKKKHKEQDRSEEDSDSEEDDSRREPRNVPVYDFDIMMAKKKEENSRKRGRRNYDVINDNDDIIAEIINQMRDAVEADNEANRNKMPALNKLKLLPFVIAQLRKIGNIRDAFLDSDVLGRITDWLAPLPDRSLTHLTIRESLLKILIDFNIYEVERIKSSGIGKAVMYLYKHPKETKENKKLAKQLISAWSRPIFSLDTRFSSISREEREERDLKLMRQHRNSRGGDEDDSDEEVPRPSSSSKTSKEDPTAPAAQKPGDKGWIPRARVPAPSMRDYVIRPQSKVDGDVGKASKRPSNMLEKLIKTQQERRRANRQQRAVNMKIDRV